ncbi:glutamate 5-kinase [Ferrimonas sediminicola]|uniref:Glutamate 5-kinase n=1 Tax=Ferrimonas sediminicola TaxID=2569538 RepID=A0A4U1BGW9_9GAMM|nr:glutamate 5-kinase [Ferrimonas sediminicola]TKB49715.1 glutamate 5-kinase [Ferrimonas sediminicola]
MSSLSVPYKRVVVKLGTSVLTSGGNSLDRAHMVELVRQMARLKRSGCEIILVTSGAIAAGREHLGQPALPASVASKQMLAAVGQSHLMQTWEHLFNLFGMHVGQMLLTRADLNDRERYLNARDTLHALLDFGIIPVVNENDAVATAEIKVGDNDNLSALVAMLADADKLILLTDQSGLFTADPRTNPEAELISEVNRITDELRKLAGGSGTNLGTGGMATKLQAADVAQRAGIPVAIAAGHSEGVIERLVRGESVGTRFCADEAPLDARKQWLLAAPTASGSITVDAGAVRALVEQGSSLLPKGITAIKGRFDRGAAVSICDPEGHPIGRGIVRYDHASLTRIIGCHSEQIEQHLGFSYGTVAVHRNDLVIL